MASPTRPEPMNASPHHSKVKAALTLSDPLYVAGGLVTGKLELECRMDKGLGIGVVMVELFAIEELTSRDHSATSTFLRTCRIFQGPGLPPSNAVLSHPLPGAPPLPANYYHARKGLTTFIFRFPLPESSPSAISFGSGLARVRYEVRASVGVAHKGENRLVTDKKDVDVVESFEEDFNRRDPEGVIVGENGKIWVQAKLLGGVVVAGQPTYVELQVKNHSSKKNSGLSVSLCRNLHFPKLPVGQKPPFQMSDTLTTVAFKGPEYVVQPGTEGVANLVFDTPRFARGVKGGPRSADDDAGTPQEPLFEVRCALSIKMVMGLGSKDIVLELPVTVLHPLALPSLPPLESYASPQTYPMYDLPYQPPMSPPMMYADRPTSPYGYIPPPMSPPSGPSYVNPNQIWLPHDMNSHPYPYFSPPPPNQHYYYPPPPNVTIPLHNGIYGPPMRPSSAEPLPSQPLHSLPTGLPVSSTPVKALFPHPTSNQSLVYNNIPPESLNEPEEGKGERASRISRHLRMSTRGRSVSPLQHRFPVSAPPQTLPEHIPSQPVMIPTRPAVSLTMKDLPGNDGSYHSPRPMLSPKPSFSIDPVTNTVAEKSERVEILERMAERVDKDNKDMSGSGGVSPNAGNEKTLPAPPVPTGKGGISTSLGARRRVEDIFPAPAGSSSNPIPITNKNEALSLSRVKEKKKTPPTPTLHAVHPMKFSRSRGELIGLAPSLSEGAGLGVPNGGLSGLDALEARLIAEVGTKKLDKDDRRMDVRSVLAMPIDIPTSRGRRPSAQDGDERPVVDDLRNEGPVDDVNDSAISSLTLAGEERPMMAMREAGGGATLRPTSRSRSRSRSRGRTAGREVDESPVLHNLARERRVSEGRKDAAAQKQEKIDGRKMRKAARGRIAAWLGSIDPDVPPPTVSTPPPTSPILGTVSPVAEVLFTPSPASKCPSPQPPAEPLPSPASLPNNGPEEDVSAAPNPRSSGFMPIGTLKDAPRSEDGSATPRPSPAQLSWLRNAENESSQPAVMKFGKNLNANSALKYDIRSARGGRGGKVTAVAAIWASGSQAGGKLAQPKPIKPTVNVPALKRLDVGKAKLSQELAPPAINRETKTKPKAGEFKRTTMAKSSYVPAVVSSSLAIPMLSSTASLVTPGDQLAGRDRPGKIGRTFGSTPTIQEDGDDNQHRNGVSGAGIFAVGKGSGGGPATPKSELAFGQARLRDLIKKYQGVGPG